MLTLLGLGCGLFTTGTEFQPWLYIEDGDLSALQERRRLRILYPARIEGPGLPRRAAPLDFDRDIAVELAQHLGLEPVLVPVFDHAHLIPWLLEGKGDLVAANLTVTEGRSQAVAFSEPLISVVEQVVAPKAQPPLADVQGLAGRKVWVRPSSSFWETLMSLKRTVPDIDVRGAPEHLDTEQLVHRVATGEYGLTVVDDNHLKSIIHYRKDVHAVLDLGDPRPVAWAMRPSSVELLAAVNAFLPTAKLQHLTDEPQWGDLSEIRARGVLRVITQNAGATYFLHQGELLGFEYEFAKRFADSLGLRLQIVVPPSGDELLNWLEEGRGDLVAAGLTVTPERRDLPGIQWSAATDQVREVVVKRRGDPLDTLVGLAGRTIVARPSSSYWTTVNALRSQGLDVKLVAVPEDQETEQIIQSVGNGTFDLTVADSTILEIEQTYLDSVVAAFPVGEVRDHAWAVRTETPDLLKAVNAFLAAEVGSTFYNVIHRRYFEDKRTIRERATARVDRGGDLSPYDALVKRHAKPYGFDWRLIVAQMYQESHFDPSARSWSGAEGLLQVKPSTAADFGFYELQEPEVGIQAGVTYLDWVHRRFDDLEASERLWFSLAAYNAGFGHVADARQLAETQGLDPNRWFDHTERAMLLLSQPRYWRRARYGYVRGDEPVNYVRRIRERYAAYSKAAESQ